MVLEAGNVSGVLVFCMSVRVARLRGGRGRDDILLEEARLVKHGRRGM